MSIIRIGLALLASCSLSIARAGDVEAGRSKAEICATCHGKAGAQPIANYPVIAGQHENYLLHSMLSYQDGTRSNAVMVQQMAEYSPTDVANLAAYFASLPSPLN